MFEAQLLENLQLKILLYFGKFVFSFELIVEVSKQFYRFSLKTRRWYVVRRTNDLTSKFMINVSSLRKVVNLVVNHHKDRTYIFF